MFCAIINICAQPGLHTWNKDAQFRLCVRACVREGQSRYPRVSTIRDHQFCAIVLTFPGWFRRFRIQPRGSWVGPPTPLPQRRPLSARSRFVLSFSASVDETTFDYLMTLVLPQIICSLRKVHFYMSAVFMSFLPLLLTFHEFLESRRPKIISYIHICYRTLSRTSRLSCTSVWTVPRLLRTDVCWSVHLFLALLPFICRPKCTPAQNGTCAYRSFSTKCCVQLLNVQVYSPRWPGRHGDYNFTLATNICESSVRYCLV